MTPPASFGPPQGSYNMGTSNYSPQPSYAAPPQSNWGVPPQTNWGAPPPQPSYGAPPPQSNWGAPPPQPSYGAPPQSNYGAPQSNWGAPPPQTNYGAPPQTNWGAPAPQPNYGAPPPGNYMGGPSTQPPNYGFAPGGCAPPVGGNPMMPAPGGMAIDARAGYVKPTGAKRAVVVGINYIHSKTGQLRGCINDTRNIRDFLLNFARFPAENIAILTDDQPMGSKFYPSKANMLSAINWLVGGATGDDSLFFHYSGHGGQSKDTSRLIFFASLVTTIY
jgi:metacaspase-1